MGRRSIAEESSAMLRRCRAFSICKDLATLRDSCHMPDQPGPALHEEPPMHVIEQTRPSAVAIPGIAHATWAGHADGLQQEGHANDSLDDLGQGDAVAASIVAIAGLESTFGQHIPPGSFNAYGWGIPSGASSGIVFSDWNDGITKVSEGLRKNYIDKGAVTLEQIGHIYAASPTWAERVGGIMNRIERYSHNIDHLELTL
jgi:hypothetical protein